MIDDLIGLEIPDSFSPRGPIIGIQKWSETVSPYRSVTTGQERPSVTAITALTGMGQVNEGPDMVPARPSSVRNLVWFHVLSPLVCGRHAREHLTGTGAGLPPWASADVGDHHVDRETGCHGAGKGSSA